MNGRSPRGTSRLLLCIKTDGNLSQHPVLKEQSDVIKNQYRSEGRRRTRKIFSSSFIVNTGVFASSFDTDVCRLSQIPFTKKGNFCGTVRSVLKSFMEMSTQFLCFGFNSTCKILFSLLIFRNRH